MIIMGGLEAVKESLVFKKVQLFTYFKRLFIITRFYHFTFDIHF